VEVVDFPIKDIKVQFRLRNPSQLKVNGIADSITQVGLIHPITIDGSNNLICGYHRLLAHKKLERQTIPTIIKPEDKRINQLIELEENLQANRLSVLEYCSHLVKREELLDDLGVLYKKGDNRFTKDESKLTIQDLADMVGLSKRSYQQRKQIATIHPEVMSLLVDTEWGNNLTELLKLSSEPDEIQRGVCDLLITGKARAWKSAFYEAKAQNYRLTSKPKLDFKVKDRFGLPKSIMKFNRSSNELSDVIRRVNDHDDLRPVKSSFGFGGTPYKLHQINPDQIAFSLDYYTNPGDLILDMFNGRGSTAITSLYLQRRFVGFEINKSSSDLTQKVIRENLNVPDNHWIIHDGCGCEMKALAKESEIIDGVFSSPPYYNKAENYSSDERDLCNLNIQDYDRKIDEMFSNLKRLIKTSDYENKRFYPIIFVLGNSRNGKQGILDLTYTFQTIAKEHGLTHWDTQHVVLNNPYICSSLTRNYEHRYVQKNYETQMVWVKF